MKPNPPSALRSLIRAVSWHRRKLAVIAAVLAVLTGINAAAPRAPDTVTVLRAVEFLPGGGPVAATQVRLEAVVAEAVPEDALTDPAQAVGRILAAPVPKGQVLTGSDLVGDRTLRPGRVLAPVRLADSGLAAVLRPGDVIDIVAADGQGGPAGTVARGVRLVTIPGADGSTGRSDSAAGVLVLVEVDDETALGLARAGSTSALSVIWR
ncbi:SAF domain-containing protein [Microlunatus speluncae]|uniref:SAF domain-containing protein n=1 Tax=Microlunatus speluncae TaxID=2594267 RepID=UPI0012666749|nr:SAF domain-containing protein [Microlunatus speluncae]